MPDDAKFEDVIRDILREIKSGCRAAGDFGTNKCELSKKADEFVKRRYKESISQRLLKNKPGDYRNTHKPVVEKVAFAHGQIAGAAWRFQKQVHQDPPDKVDVVTLAKAGHLMELECQAYLASRGESFADRGGYCW
jgi:hypothetical protein